MMLASTRNPSHIVPFRDAVLTGLAPDGGLYVPTALPRLPAEFFTHARWEHFSDAAYAITAELLRGDVPDAALRTIVDEAITFDAPLVPIDDSTFILELTHGPTLAFKDVGARFMARLLPHLAANDDRERVVLVATSGDTGSAVAAGFHGVSGIHVVILYPSGGVSATQEQMLTTLGGNVTALEVRGTFDDCQRLVKQAFADSELRTRRSLSSANSINIARLIPQTFAYAYAYHQLIQRRGTAELPSVIISVPSGNFGHLTAGLMVKHMGLPVTRFIAACNVNDVFAEYLQTGTYTPRPSVKTPSSAMDVGSPSNMERILSLYGNDVERVRADVWGSVCSDEETRAAISDVYRMHRYVLDPHGAVGYWGLQQYRKQNTSTARCIGIIIETAHPAKFPETVEDALGIRIEVPDRMRTYLAAAKRAVPMENSFPALKDFLLSGGH